MCACLPRPVVAEGCRKHMKSIADHLRGLLILPVAHEDQAPPPAIAKSISQLFNVPLYRVSTLYASGETKRLTYTTDVDDTTAGRAVAPLAPS